MCEHERETICEATMHVAGLGIAQNLCVDRSSEGRFEERHPVDKRLYDPTA